MSKRDEQIKALTEAGLETGEARELHDGGTPAANDKQAGALAKSGRQPRFDKVQLQISGRSVTQDVRGRLVQDDTGALTGEFETRDPESGKWTKHAKGTWRYAK